MCLRPRPLSPHHIPTATAQTAPPGRVTYHTHRRACVRVCVCVSAYVRRMYVARFSVGSSRPHSKGGLLAADPGPRRGVGVRGRGCRLAQREVGCTVCVAGPRAGHHDGTSHGEFFHCEQSCLNEPAKWLVVQVVVRRVRPAWTRRQDQNLDQNPGMQMYDGKRTHHLSCLVY